jgi:hypothetical protein
LSVAGGRQKGSLNKATVEHIDIVWVRGDRRSAALEQTEGFKSIQVPDTPPWWGAKDSPQLSI